MEIDEAQLLAGLLSEITIPERSSFSPRVTGALAIGPATGLAAFQSRVLVAGLLEPCAGPDDTLH